jgi:hypothetical protein
MRQGSPGSVNKKLRVRAVRRADVKILPMVGLEWAGVRYS